MPLARLARRPPFLLALLAASAAAQQLTLQPCLGPTFVGEDLVVSAADGSIADTHGHCVTDAGGGGAVMSTCVAGSAAQRWIWRPEGSVESGANAGSCWNANGGSTAQGTAIIMYSCDSQLAANDIFFPLTASKRILGNESGLCLSAVAAPPPPPPPPANGSCVDAFDCSLSGACVAGMCACYPPWTAAPDCSALAFLPSPLQRGYPQANHNETTWGGSIVQDPVGFGYHLYVAEMMNECPLSTWGQNSRCTHAVSATPEGPYSFSDVAVTNWCHNPHTVVQKNDDGSYTWALFHIGDGTGGDTKNCTTSSSSALSPAPAAGSTLHTAPAPGGPWTPAAPLPSCNNPAPFLASNGTWFLLCDGFELYRAASLTAGWVHVVTVRASGSPIAGNYEDPLLFIDPRWNFHIIYHVYRTGGAEAHNCLPGHDGAVVSGHYFSADGIAWRTSPTMPYLNVVDLADGTQQLLTTRERPKFLFNAAGEPTHLSNGVCPSPGGFNTPISCPEVSTGCVDCKYNDWDYTNVSPLKL